MTFQKGVKFRIYPNREQRNLIDRTLGCSRLIYNKGLAMRENAFKSGENVKEYLDAFMRFQGLAVCVQKVATVFLYPYQLIPVQVFPSAYKGRCKWHIAVQCYNAIAFDYAPVLRP